MKMLYFDWMNSVYYFFNNLCLILVKLYLATGIIPV